MPLGATVTGLRVLAISFSPWMTTCLVLCNAYLIAKRARVNARNRPARAMRSNEMPATPSASRRKRRGESERAGVQSVVVAARVLKALAGLGGAATLKDLAAEV